MYIKSIISIYNRFEKVLWDLIVTVLPILSDCDPCHLWFIHHKSHSTGYAYCYYLIPQHTITTKFCTWHDSTAVVPCAKFCCDYWVRFWMEAKQNFELWWKIVGGMFPWSQALPNHQTVLILSVSRHLPEESHFFHKAAAGLNTNRPAQLPQPTLNTGLRRGKGQRA